MPLPDCSAREIAQLLLARDPLPPLVPTQVFDPVLTPQIEASRAEALVKIGLHLLNDDLAAAHVLAQKFEGEPLADYWHAIIHRREGDYGNARYWFGRVGPLPLLTQIYGTNPNAPGEFVARCRTAAERGSDTALEQFQHKEITQILNSLLGAEELPLDFVSESLYNKPN